MFKLIITLAALLVLAPSCASAANISSPSYAWSESVGWIKFDSGAGAVTVSDDALSGHVYNDNIGWIVLDGVTHDGEGALSGYAWGESIGYVDFSDVIILDGQFYGYAYNDNIGFISLNCANTSSCGDVDYKVSTTWVLPVIAPAPVATPVPTASRSGGRRRLVPSVTPVMLSVPVTAGCRPGDSFSITTGEQCVFSSGATTKQILSAPTQRDLTTDFEGEDVRQLQIFLNASGFTVAATGAGSPGSETTYFGTLTRQALARFQATHGIAPVAGYFGPVTRAFIASMK